MKIKKSCHGQHEKKPLIAKFENVKVFDNDECIWHAMIEFVLELNMVASKNKIFCAFQNKILANGK